MAARLPEIVQVAFGSAGSPAVLRGVTNGHAIIVMTAFYRAILTGAQEALPTTSNAFSGAFQLHNQGRTPLSGGITEIGQSNFMLKAQNCGGGDHTITSEANTKSYVTAIEVGNLRQTPFPFDYSVLGSNFNVTDHLIPMSFNGVQTQESVELQLATCSVGATSGLADAAFTDPIAGGFTTLQKNVNEISDVAFIHAYRVVGQIGSYDATFEWAAPVSVNSFVTMLGSYFGLKDQEALPTISGGDLYF